jgi:hypothetical protein
LLCILARDNANEWRALAELVAPSNDRKRDISLDQPETECIAGETPSAEQQKFRQLPERSGASLHSLSRRRKSVSSGEADSSLRARHYSSSTSGQTRIEPYKAGCAGQHRMNHRMRASGTTSHRSRALAVRNKASYNVCRVSTQSTDTADCPGHPVYSESCEHDEPLSYETVYCSTKATQEVLRLPNN